MCMLDAEVVAITASASGLDLSVFCDQMTWPSCIMLDAGGGSPFKHGQVAGGRGVIHHSAKVLGLILALVPLGLLGWRPRP